VTSLAPVTVFQDQSGEGSSGNTRFKRYNLDSPVPPPTPATAVRHPGPCGRLSCVRGSARIVVLPGEYGSTEDRAIDGGPPHLLRCPFAVMWQSFGLHTGWYQPLGYVPFVTFFGRCSPNLIPGPAATWFGLCGCPVLVGIDSVNGLTNAVPGRLSVPGPH